MNNTNLNRLKNVLTDRKNLINYINLKYTEILELEERFSANKIENLKKHFTPAFSDINESIIVKISLIQEHIKYFENSKYEPLKNSGSVFEEEFSKKIVETGKQLNYLTGRVDTIILNLSTFSDSENISTLELKTLENIYPIKREILKLLNNISESFEFIKNGMIDAEIFELEYIKRFNQESSLIKKSFENNIFEITSTFESKFKNIELEYSRVSKSNNLLNTSVDAGLKKLAELNQRTQNIELEFSNILSTETEKVKKDLNSSRTALNNVIQEITTSANTKLNEINKAHTDFINLVSNAGIYKLTENYDKKATEEKKQYETYRTYTSRAIGAAIVFTVIILTIPLIEYWGANPAVDTNYYTILARLTISLMFFVLALYFSKQASKHYECYQENHRTFLQLAALEPFMANMTAEEKQEIRKSLVPSYFNQGADGKFATKGDDVDMSMMFTFMDKLSNFAQNKKDTKATESTNTETKPVV